MPDTGMIVPTGTSTAPVMEQTADMIASGKVGGIGVHNLKREHMTTVKELHG